MMPRDEHTGSNLQDEQHGTGARSVDGIERRVRCSCGLNYGWFDAKDADHLAAHHAENCDGDVEYKEREKEGQNYSDRMKVTRDDYLLSVCRHCDDGREHECKFCGEAFQLPGPRDRHQEVCMAP